MSVDDELLSWIEHSQDTPVRKAFFALMNFRSRTVTLRLRRLLENGTVLVCSNEFSRDEILLQRSDWRLVMARILKDMRKELRLAAESRRTKETSEETQ
jgi:hypothetical protein